MTIKILFCCNINFDNVTKSNAYNGGGWIQALIELLQNSNLFDIGIAYYSDNRCKKFTSSGLTFFPISFDRKIKNRLSRFISRESRKTAHVNELKKVIKEFEPDLIQVFGSEKPFGLVAKYCDIPLVLHVQGTLTIYQNSFLPPGVSYFKWLCAGGNNPLKILNRIREYRALNESCLIELEIYEALDYIIGRTDWDKRFARLYSKAHYYHCDEVLRPIFYDYSEPIIENKGILRIVSTISNPDYKGSDQILKAAKILYETSDVKFEWKVFGVDEMKNAEKYSKIRSRDVNVYPSGVVSADTLHNELSRADVYVHPSYIENVCLSISEARMLRLPVIANYAGGMRSTINHYVDGLLLPSNEPHMVASYIQQLHQDKQFALAIATEGQRAACKRHAKSTILSDLLVVYGDMLGRQITLPDEETKEGIVAQ